MKNAWKNGTSLLTHIGSLLAAMALGSAGGALAEVPVPYTFSPGTAISSSQVNENFAVLARSMPGIKTALASRVTLSTQWQNLATLTVTPPVDGMLLLLGSASITITQGSTAGGSSWSTSSLALCVTATSGGGGPCNGALVMLDTVPLPSGVPVQPYSPRLTLPATIIDSVSVTRNTPVTYYLTGSVESGSAGSTVVNTGALTAVFLPGGYMQ